MAQGLYPKTTTFYEAIVLAGPSVLQRNEYEVLLSLIWGGGGRCVDFEQLRFEDDEEYDGKRTRMVPAPYVVADPAGGD
jgi:hypothetical protein